MGFSKPLTLPADLAREDDLVPLAKEATLTPKSAEATVVVRALETTASIARRRRLYRGTISMPDGGGGLAQSVAATLSPAVTDLARADVRKIGATTPDAANARDWNVRMTLTNATTLTATRQGNFGSINVDFEVTEWL